MNSEGITQDFEILKGLPIFPARYRSFFFPSTPNRWDRCFLILTGTSTKVFDVAYFIEKVLAQGYTVAAIERSIGGPMAFLRKRDAERLAALKHFLNHLYNDVGIESIDILAHSYAAQEVVRALDGRPTVLLPRINMISLINPSGFGNTSGFLQHCLRFVFLFVIRDYFSNLTRFLGQRKSSPEIRADCRRVMRGILLLFVQTILNPGRTFKEVDDIVNCDLRPAVRKLVTEDGRRLQVFLSKGDTLISNQRTKDFFLNELPSVSCIDLPGNHLDPLLCQSCVQKVIDALKGQYSQ